ncbi:hypothetical protein Scep_022214 [Stephania cephalantha]|uniref:Uncharacterized protein n=1 Tax=Stephania cephalantha TaxID=152367 RepID=A0AAP0F4Y4_9MAGN
MAATNEPSSSWITALYELFPMSSKTATSTLQVSSHALGFFHFVVELDWGCVICNNALPKMPLSCVVFHSSNLDLAPCTICGGVIEDTLQTIEFLLFQVDNKVMAPNSTTSLGKLSNRLSSQGMRELAFILSE